MHPVQRRRGQHRGGRRSKGDRHQFWISRMAPEQVDAVLREAALRGLPFGEYIALVVMREHGLDVRLPEPTLQLESVQPATHERYPKLSTRVPRVGADLVMDEAYARDMPYSAYLAAVLARAHGFPAVLPDRQQGPLPQQEVLTQPA